MTLGDRIKKLREGHGWGIAELSHRSGVDYNTILRVENNQYAAPNIFSLRDLAITFRMTLDEMMRDIQKPEKKPRRKTTRG